MSQDEFQQQLKVAYENERDLVTKQCGDGAKFDSVNNATKTFYQRLDDTIKGASMHVSEGVDCRQGCSYCCYFRVDVSANEVFTLADYVQSTFDKNDLDNLLQKATDNKKKISMLSQAKRVVTNIACPLLDEEGSCTVYEARPSMCRKIHSTDVQACKASYDTPEEANIKNAEHPVLSAITMTMLTAARDGFSAKGMDPEVYDLNEVLIDALEDGKYKKRWLNGKKAFPS
ncbi:MAG: hypothetical protein COB62_05565 [Piscirickettsiaceae bacterium]|nr:MAG: hypothetical protein COB62_05565 [Piscirickettsiaceae bacterium]